MIEASLANSAYNSSMRSIGSDRGVEYQIFSNVTRDLAAIRAGAHDYHAKLAEALHKNLKLWTFLAGEVANENNPLPPKLRAGIFYLAEFTRHQTAKIHAGNGSPDILVEINTSIMRGLRARKDENGEESCQAD